MVKWAKGCKVLRVPEAPVSGRCFYYLHPNRKGGRKVVTPQASSHCVYSGPLLLSLTQSVPTLGRVTHSSNVPLPHSA